MLNVAFRLEGSIVTLRSRIRISLISTSYNGGGGTDGTDMKGHSSLPIGP